MSKANEYPYDVFLSHSSEDKPWVAKLKEDLHQYGIRAWIDNDEILAGDNIVNAVTTGLKKSRHAAIILSPEAIKSDWVANEIQASLGQTKSSNQKRRTIPIKYRLTTLPINLEIFKAVDFSQENNYSDALVELVTAITGKKPEVLIDILNTPPPPLAQQEVPFAELRIPGGALINNSPYYIERIEDHKIHEALTHTTGETISIIAPRQTGKTSMLVRAIGNLPENYQVITIDFQKAGQQAFASSKDFINFVIFSIVRELKLDKSIIKELKDLPTTDIDHINCLFEDYIFPRNQQPLLLTMDELDRLTRTDFSSDFFGMIRAWHNNRAFNSNWRRLSILLVISTESNLLIQNPDQSPFNVGLKLTLQDHDYSQIKKLNKAFGQPLNNSALQHMHDYLNGHPYLSALTIYTIKANNKNLTEIFDNFDKHQSIYHDHLSRYLDIIQQQPELRLTMIDILSEKKTSNLNAFKIIEQIGLVQGEPNSCYARCQLYQDYFAKKLNR